MKYDSLLLNCGGGIINPAIRSAQSSQSAALCIGIGGTGVAALSDLKGKIYQQLQPDNPGEPTPRYDGIQLLGIDSDETTYTRYAGNRKLSRDEFFSIKKDDLSYFFQTYQGKQRIKDDPVMDWMEIDEINKLMTPVNLYGVRQIGRFLLLSKASALLAEIEKKCRQALQKRGGDTLDIYIFAGISGGTGGCFLDICYLLRKAAEKNGWNASIMGYFFLPDVITSKPEITNNPAAVRHNNSNGYAALKELNYLMNLSENGDWFEQDYGDGIKLRTQLPPVDMCHLISLQREDGSVTPNGFRDSVRGVADCVLISLAGVDPHGSKENVSSWTMRDQLAKVYRGVQGIPRRWGINLSYHILGTANAEIPMTQINTYLAAGFFRKFAAVKVSRNAVTKDTVQKLMEELQLTVGQVYNSVIANTRELQLSGGGMIPAFVGGILPKAWENVYNDWVAECDGIMTANTNALTKKLDGFDYNKINVQSLIGRLFRKLWELSIDPAYGPYYAAYLLSNNGEDLNAALGGEIEKADGQEEAKDIQLPEMQDQVTQYYPNLAEKKDSEKAYDRYTSAVENWLNTEMARLQCFKTAAVLREFREQVRELYTAFFQPLCEMLDNLQETFEENAKYLAALEARNIDAHTRLILTLDEMKPRLDSAIEALDPTQTVKQFMQNILVYSANWLKKDPDKLVQQISNDMLELFSKETNRSLQDYLYEKFPWTNGNPTALADEIETKILRPIHDAAIPMFWCDTTYKIADPTFTFESSSLSVPNSCSAICTAAANFSNNNPNYTVRETGIGNRIIALRTINGVPLFAYAGLMRLKADYDAAASTAAGAGTHLYANTGRGKSTVDWRTYLPTPIPYSLIM